MREGSMVRATLGGYALALDRVVRLAIPVWFVVVSAMRIQSLVPLGPPGYDGLLYRQATLTWLSGGDPWQPPISGAAYAAPPPSLLAMLPFALVPPEVAVAALIGLGLGGTIWALRRLRMPLWWLAFPPLVDGLWIANPHVLVLPLLVAGAGPLAALVKVYAGVPIVAGLRWREITATVAILLVTALFLPWGTFFASYDRISAALAQQANGTGLSALAVPILLPVAVIAVVAMRRKRALWWLVPVFWPFTQFYYASLIIPGATPLGGLLASVPVPGAVVLGAAATVLELRMRRAMPSDD